jgi:hypothetical protein
MADHTIKQSLEGIAKGPQSGQQNTTSTINIPSSDVPIPQSQPTLQEMEYEVKRLELEAKRLEVAERTANLEDVKERLGDRELKRETQRSRSRTNGKTLLQLKANDDAAQGRCNHRKGGDGVRGIVGGQGDDSQHAVIKHMFGNGDIWVRCLRCGKTWKPPMKDRMTVEAYYAAMAEYQAAVNFTTRNTTSGSVMFKWSDGGQFYREVTEQATLR